MRRLAESGSSAKEIAAISGHRTLKEIERYTAAADQVRLSKACDGQTPGQQKANIKCLTRTPESVYPLHKRPKNRGLSHPWR